MERRKCGAGEVGYICGSGPGHVLRWESWGCWWEWKWKGHVRCVSVKESECEGDVVGPRSIKHPPAFVLHPHNTD
jgi:hypothetical protein